MPRRLACVLALALAACGDPTAEPTDAGPPETDAGPPPDAEALLAEGEALFYRALGGEKEQRRAAIRTLARGLALEPDHPRGSLMYGMALLSAIAEDNDLRYAADAIPALEHAMAVNPDDRRIPGWLGTVRVAMAQALGDEEALEEAIAFMVEAADRWPDFNNFSLAIAFAPLPLESGYPAMALERMNAIAGCGARTDVCTNASVPHNEEGSLMTFGDIHARLGDAEQARAYYRMAVEHPDAASWPYRDEAQAFLDAVDERVARFTNDDPSDDPRFFSAGETSCVGCHAP
jgi:tetratricopeptide (TPR) repeat protein